MGGFYSKPTAVLSLFNSIFVFQIQLEMTKIWAVEWRRKAWAHDGEARKRRSCRAPFRQVTARGVSTELLCATRSRPNFSFVFPDSGRHKSKNRVRTRVGARLTMYHTHWQSLWCYMFFCVCVSWRASHVRSSQHSFGSSPTWRGWQLPQVAAAWNWSGLAQISLFFPQQGMLHSDLFVHKTNLFPFVCSEQRQHIDFVDLSLKHSAPIRNFYFLANTDSPTPIFLLGTLVLFQTSTFTTSQISHTALFRTRAYRKCCLTLPFSVKILFF